MRKLILVKHAQPQVVASVPPSQWRLAEAGGVCCQVLAHRLAQYNPALIITSSELKAQETGQELAKRLGKPIETAPDLHEHERDNVPQMPTPEFISMMALVFQRPGSLVLGHETADQARERFSRAITEILRTHSVGNIVVVSHGTVISLFVAQRTGTEAFALWRRMSLPSFVVLSIPELAVLDIVDRVD